MTLLPALPASEREAPPELSPEEQRRGRRLALTSHPFSMTYRMAFMGDLATQALVTLGAGPGAVGAFASLGGFASLLQLLGLRLVDRFGKRRLLIATQALACAASLPLLWFGWLQGLDAPWGWQVAWACLGVTSLALVCGSAAWWPLLHGYVPRSQTGRFFSVLRTLWHLFLIAFFVGCALWLRASPGGFAPLFGLAWSFGLVRIAVLWRAPERAEGAARPIGSLFGELYRTPALRRYVIGVTLDQAVFRCMAPFTILLLRNHANLGEGQVMVVTVATFAGGMVALLPAGRLVDRLGPRPVLFWTCLVRGALVAGVGAAGIFLEGPALVAAVAGLFVGWSFLFQAFGVAEVKVLFELAGEHNPTQLIVGSIVVRALFAGAIALLAGSALELLLRYSLAPPLTLYLWLFAGLALLQAGAALPFLRASEA